MVVYTYNLSAPVPREKMQMENSQKLAVQLSWYTKKQATKSPGLNTKESRANIQDKHTTSVITGELGRTLWCQLRKYQELERGLRG